MIPVAPRFVLCPGYVISRNDGQRHYVSANALRQLYGVPARACACLRDLSPGRRRRGGHSSADLARAARGDLSAPALRW